MTQNRFRALAYHSVLPPSSADWIPSVAPAFSEQLFGPLAFSGFGHCTSSVLLANFTLHRGELGAWKRTSDQNQRR